MKKYLIPTLISAAALATPAFAADEVEITFSAQNNAPSGNSGADVAWTVSETAGYYVGTNLSSGEIKFSWGALTDTDTGYEGVLMNQNEDALDNGVVIPHSSTNYTLSFTITATESVEISSIAFQFVGAYNGGSITNAKDTTMSTTISLSGEQDGETTSLASTTVTIYGTTLAAVQGEEENETYIERYEADYIVLNFDTITLEGGDSITFTLGVGGTGAMQVGIQSIVVGLPEPSAFGLFFGLGAIGLVATRRRRKVA